jgi:hypothetical protein
MLAGVEERTQRFKQSSHEQLLPQAEAVTVKVDGNAIIERYGLEHIEPPSDVHHSDPVALAERVLRLAKKAIRQDKHHDWMMFLRDGGGKWNQHTMIARDRTEKQILMQMVARFVEAHGCDAVVEVGEMWTASIPIEELSRTSEVENVTGRGEALVVMVATREGLVRQYSTPIKRGPFGGIKLEDTVELEKLTMNYLQPVFRVWQAQRYFRGPDGRQSQVWEPDALDLCPCGGPNRYAECCQPMLLKFDTKTASENVARAMAERDFQSAEVGSRAHLAQYMIWIRQHTAATMHQGKQFYEMMVPVDALALESLIDTMIWVLTAAEKTDQILFQLRRLTDFVGVPRLAVRITALTSRWLLSVERAEEGVIELDSLGSPYEVTDSLALALIARHFDLTDGQRKALLRRAIDVAFCDEEKQLARLNAASYLSGHGAIEESLSLVDAVLTDTANITSSSEHSQALILRWKVTNSESDFPDAFSEMVTEDDVHQRIRNGIYLIDHSKYKEAEELLAGLRAAQLYGADSACERLGRVELAPGRGVPQAAAAAAARPYGDHRRALRARPPDVVAAACFSL